MSSEQKNLDRKGEKIGYMRYLESCGKITHDTLRALLMNPAYVDREVWNTIRDLYERSKFDRLNAYVASLIKREGSLRKVWDEQDNQVVGHRPFTNW